MNLKHGYKANVEFLKYDFNNNLYLNFLYNIRKFRLQVIKFC